VTGKTSIEWTDQPGYVGAVWNPTTGCTRVSAGCDNCYAFALHDKRYATNLKTAEIFFDKNDSAMPPSNRRDLVASGRDQGAALPWPKQYDLPFSRVQLLPERLDAPLRTRRPTCYFVDSMADLFHEDVPDEFLMQVWSTMERATWHRFLILTKRPQLMRERLGDEPPLPNVWLGTSVEDQASADERIPHLLATPAAVRFLSCEPLLGEVNLGEYLWWDHTPMHLQRDPEQYPEDWSPTEELHWVIVGGESGPRARPMDLAWARSLRDQCVAAGVSFFMKQMGSVPMESDSVWRARPLTRVLKATNAPRVPDGFVPIALRESHGRDMSEWPEDLRIREFPR
jgi:protein gp37